MLPEESECIQVHPKVMLIALIPLFLSNSLYSVSLWSCKA